MQVEEGAGRDWAEAIPTKASTRTHEATLEAIADVAFEEARLLIKTRLTSWEHKAALTNEKRGNASIYLLIF